MADRPDSENQECSRRRSASGANKDLPFSEWITPEPARDEPDSPYWERTGVQFTNDHGQRYLFGESRDAWLCIYGDVPENHS